LAWLGLAWLGLAWLGLAWLGLAWLSCPAIVKFWAVGASGPPSSSFPGR